MSITSNIPEDLTLDKAESIFDKGIEKIAYNRPLLIILYGPPGSGKTSANKMIEDIFKIPIGDFTHIESDALVTSIRSYRTKTKAMYNSLPDKNHPSQNFYESMDAYKQSVSQTKNREDITLKKKGKSYYKRH